MKKNIYMSWNRDGDNLILGDSTVLSIVRKFGTPLYLYDGNIANNRLELVKRAFPGFKILYSIKSNPNPEIVRVMSNGCTGAEVASLQELKTALENGYKPESITFGGPGKPFSDIKFAVESNIGNIDLESEKELVILEEVCNQLNKKKILSTIRINTLHRPANAGEYMSGGPSRYGIDEEVVVETMGKYSPKNILFNGIHAHVASQVLHPTYLLEHFRKTAELSKMIASALDFDLNIVNFGGGFGVPYSPGDTFLDIFTLGEDAETVLSETFSGLAKPEFQLELGRFLVAECGIFLTEIVDIKHSRGVNFVITESGINGFSRPAMHWAQQHPCTIISKENSKPTGIYDIVGPSCLPTDVLCKNTELSDPQPGDIIAIHNAGAYGYTMSMLFWSSRPAPLEVVFINGDFICNKKQWEEKNVLIKY